jgi:hypothetical protein
MAEPFPTSGKVTFADGTPLRGGVIYFKPVEVQDGDKLRYEAGALVNASGEYKLGFNGDGKGAPAGEYKVVIEPRDYQELAGSNSNRIPNSYREKASTPLTATVKEEENTLNFVLR